MPPSEFYDKLAPFSISRVVSERKLWVLLPVVMTLLHQTSHLVLYTALGLKPHDVVSRSSSRLLTCASRTNIMAVLSTWCFAPIIPCLISLRMPKFFKHSSSSSLV